MSVPCSLSFACFGIYSQLGIAGYGIASPQDVKTGYGGQTPTNRGRPCWRQSDRQVVGLAIVVAPPRPVFRTPDSLHPLLSSFLLSDQDFFILSDTPSAPPPTWSECVDEQS